MSGDIQLGIKLVYDGKAVTGGVEISRADFRKLSKDAMDAGKAIAGGHTAAAEGIRSISDQLSRVQGVVAGLVAGNQFTQWGMTVMSAAQSVTSLNARLKSVTTSADEFARAQAGVTGFAQRWGAALGDAGAAFARLNPALGQMGGNAASTLKVMDALAASFRISGATASETSAVMLQFSQAMGSGVVQGDEFRSLMEGAQPLMREVAKVMGKNVGELKKMGSEGRLTSEEFGNAVLLASARLKAMAEGIPPTFEAATQAVKNSATVIAHAFVEGIKGDAGSGSFLADLARGMADSTTAAEALGNTVRDMTGTVIGLAGAYATLKVATRLGPAIEDSLAAGRATVVQTMATRAGAIATRDAAGAEIARLTTMRGLLEKQREQAQAMLQTSNATVQATAGMGVHSAALAASREATGQRSAALRALGDVQRGLLAVDQQLTVATHAHREAVTAASVAVKLKTGAMSALSGAMAAFGGPAGLAITALTGLGVWAFESRREIDALEKSMWQAAKAKGAMLSGKAPDADQQQGLAAQERLWKERFDDMQRKGQSQTTYRKGTAFFSDLIDSETVTLQQAQARYGLAKQVREEGEKARAVEAAARAAAEAAEKNSLADPAALARLTENYKSRSRIEREHVGDMEKLAKARRSALAAAKTDETKQQAEDDYAGGVAGLKAKHTADLAALPGLAEARARQAAQSEAAISAAKGMARRTAEYYKQELDQFRLSTTDFVAEMARVEADALRKQRNAVAAERPRDAAGKIKQEGRLDEIDAQLLEVADKYSRMAEDFVQKREAALGKMNAELGKEARPDQRAFAGMIKDYGEELRRASANGDQETLGKLFDVRALREKTEAFGDMGKQFAAQIKQMEASLAGTQIGVQLGGLTADAAAFADHGIRQKALPGLLELRAEMAAAADGSEPLKLALAELDKRLADLGVSLAKPLPPGNIFEAAGAASRDYLQGIGSMARGQQEMFTRSFMRIEDSFVKMATGMKVTSRDLFTTLLADAARLYYRQQFAPGVADAMSAATKWVGNSLGFGGGRAAGGPVSAQRFYRVNENEPELLTVDGEDYLMMGGRTGHVTPPGRAPAGSLSASNAGAAIQVVVYDQRSAPTAPPVEVSQGTGGDGLTQIRVLIRDEVRSQITGGQQDSAMRARYGVTPVLTRRG